MLALPYGSRPYALDLGARDATVVEPARLPAAGAPREIFDAALAAPIGAPRLRSLQRGLRITLIVSDATRAEPRAELVGAILDEMPSAHVTLAIATGTHGPCGFDRLGFPAGWRERFEHVVDHDGHRDDDLVELGRTRRGTPVRLHRCVVEADLVIATGCIRPHYFAGFGAGAKAVFPGLGAARDIRLNHRLKLELAARAGIVDGNPCREDIEEAVARVATPVFLLNGVCGPDGAVHAAVAGDLQAAFRAGTATARPWFTVRAPLAPTVIASDALPVTASLYQASKIAAAVAPMVAPNGTLVVVAECPEGTGPVDTVNSAIYDIGIRPRLAAGVRVVLVSSLSRDVVGKTYATWARRAEDVVGDGPVVVVPRATSIILEGA